ncbi:DUF3140 domain-containing protein [Actinoallomurus rhizosphaericola]|uniref:DUF3140 domain-containing protein n=1 Tax=Actinoallomurus rhizosphaericola TaxID=2952536 RepID=UPI0020936543|nr:DUF3140 domain-containing protein [Actinoallomurus rhizosphaericola]MCO5999842.1 DUF3140 domain-containing protein [Actinoallomurus rhizosphaericola]
MTDRTAPEVGTLWEEFHRVVNMTSEELRTWLLTVTSGEEAFPDDPDRLWFGLGTEVVKILGKRKVDLTDDDLRNMRRTVDEVTRRLESPPERGAADDAWRRALMTLGHDPLRPDPHGSEDLP